MGGRCMRPLPTVAGAAAHALARCGSEDRKEDEGQCPTYRHDQGAA